MVTKMESFLLEKQTFSHSPGDQMLRGCFFLQKNVSSELGIRKFRFFGRVPPNTMEISGLKRFSTRPGNGDFTRNSRAPTPSAATRPPQPLGPSLRSRIGVCKNVCKIGGRMNSGWAPKCRKPDAPWRGPQSLEGRCNVHRTIKQYGAHC